MSLLKSQKNKLFESIKRYGLEPFNFEWDDRVEASILRYRDTSYFFSVEIERSKFVCSYSPGSNIIYERSNLCYWDVVVIYFEGWLNFVMNEISQPDLWAEIEKIKEFGDIEYEIESTMEQFTYQEVKQIETGIEEIRRYLLNEVNNDDEDSKIINEKLDYLIESSERMGKKDWANIFYGAMVSLSISLALDPGQGQAMFQLFKNVVSGIIKLISAHGI